MKKVNYISRVLSHIKGRRGKAVIEHEFFDHIDEKEKEYAALGYAADGALAIAETAMGDADVVGEQFDSLLQQKTKKTALGYAFSVFTLLLTVGVCLMIVLITMGSGIYSYTVAADNAVQVFSLPAAVVECAVFVLNLISMFIGASKKRIVNLSLGFAGVEGMIVFGTVIYNFSLNYYLERFRDFDVLKMFYGDAAHRRSLDFELAFNYWIGVFLLLLFAAALYVIICTKRLKNGKRELKLKKAVSGILLSLSVVALILCVAVCAAVKMNENKICAEAKESLTAVEKSLIDKTAAMTFEDYYSFQNGEWEFLDGCSVYTNFQPVMMDAIMEPRYITDYGDSDAFVRVHAYSDDALNDYALIFDVSSAVFCPMNFQQMCYNPFLSWLPSSLTDGAADTVSNYYNLYSNKDLSSVPYGADISEAPLPAQMQIRLPYNTDGDYSVGTVTLYYNEDASAYLVYEYDEESKRYLLTENTEISYPEETTLTAEQRLALTDMLQTTFIDKLFGDMPEAYGIYAYKPFGIYHNANYDVYRIDIAVGLVLQQMQYSLPDAPDYMMSLGVRFKDGVCEMLKSDNYTLFVTLDTEEAYYNGNAKWEEKEIRDMLDERSQPRYDYEETRRYLAASYNKYRDYQNALETFREIPVPQTTEDVIALAQEWAPNDWHTEEDLEQLRTKPSFSFSANDSYDVMVGTDYGIGKSKWLLYDTADAYLLTPDDWRYIRDIPLGLTEEEFYRCCGVYAPYQYCETEDGKTLITLYFHDGETWAKFSYTFEDGVLTVIEPSEEFAESYQ